MFNRLVPQSSCFDGTLSDIEKRECYLLLDNCSFTYLFTFSLTNCSTQKTSLTAMDWHLFLCFFLLLDLLLIVLLIRVMVLPIPGITVLIE